MYSFENGPIGNAKCLGGFIESFLYGHDVHLVFEPLDEPGTVLGSGTSTEMHILFYVAYSLMEKTTF